MFTCPTREDVRRVLDESAQALLEQQESLGRWSFPAYLGTHYISLYALFVEWLRFRGFSSRLNLNRLAEILVATQLPDGSWAQVRDPALDSGDINATIINYAALKFFRSVIGIAGVPEAMHGAREFILKSGGLAAVNQFTKTFLALFGLHTWEDIRDIPYLIFLDGLPQNYRRFSQWVIPHLIPMAYLRHNRISRRIRGTFGPELRLDELSAGDGMRILEKEARPSSWYDGLLVRKILHQQRSYGSWGGYTVSTLLSIAALDHFNRKCPGHSPSIPAAIKRGLEFVDSLYFDHGEGSYLGCLMHGAVWDTILAAQGLVLAGERSTAVVRAARNLYQLQVPCGGFPYGKDFEAYPDVDDTSRALVVLKKMAPLTPGRDAAQSRRKGLRWLLKRQNCDGGWGAFDQDNVGSRIVKLFTHRLSDSVELFDASSADSTGHVLRALGAFGLTLRNCRAVRRAVRFLQCAQDPVTGLWEGRWAINWLYGTAQAGTGLIQAGESSRSPYLVRAARSLMALQNSDGGFGESTLSYIDEEYRGRGVSTPTQTAWVLEFLCHMGLQDTHTSIKAANYLVETRDGLASWHDGSVVGTGHPGLLYMEYPVYPKVFPVMALAAYLAGQM